MSPRFGLPEQRPTGICLGCHRVLISDVYQLCWSCAQGVFEAPAFVPLERDPLEELYSELGGEA